MSFIPAPQLVSIPRWKGWVITVVIAVILVSAGAGQTVTMYLDALAIAGLLAEALVQQCRTATPPTGPVH